MPVRADDRQSRYCPVECGRCGALVQAAKFSPQHTSVQWDAPAVGRCEEFAAAAADGRGSPLVERCESMLSSIDAAAADGRLPVVPPWLPWLERPPLERPPWERPLAAP
jgi:hypothetical protein